MFSATPTAPPAAALQSALAQQRAEAVRLNRQAYVQLQSRASPVRPRPATELVELAPSVEPDRRERFWGEFLKSLVHRDRVQDVRSLVRNRPYLLQFEDVHRGMSARAYAASLDRTAILRVLDELAKGVQAQSEE